MKSRKGSWSLVKVPLFPQISRDEKLYWRSMASKTSKVGIELEMNLPDNKGTCSGKNMFCSCVNISTGCWKECIKLETCSKTPNYGCCAIFHNNTCGGPGIKECEGCKDFKFDCPSINCIDFVSKCHTCGDRRIDCDICPERYDPEKDPIRIRDNLIKKFQPTKNFSKAGNFGVWSITHDGSLKGEGGVEVITVGRRFHFKTFYKMMKEIIDTTNATGAYLDERCGIHCHLLCGYYEKGGTELEIPMPAIILANLLQLVRKYQPALVWLTSAGHSYEHLTRWEKFRLGMFNHTPMTKRLVDIKRDMSVESKPYGNTKYHFMNIQRCNFYPDDNVSTFHVEFRFPDSINCPIIIASQAAMLNAMLIKAIDFSQYGLLEFADSPEERETIEKAFIAICNGKDDPSTRVSNTKGAEKFFDYYRETSRDLLDILKPIMLNDGPTYDILVDLSNSPVSLRRIRGMKDEEIEAEMRRFIRPVDEQLEERIMAAIDLSMYTECENIKEWITKLIQDMIEEDKTIDGSEVAETIEGFVLDRVERHDMVWNTKTGTLVFIGG